MSRQFRGFHVAAAHYIPTSICMLDLMLTPIDMVLLILVNVSLVPRIGYCRGS